MTGSSAAALVPAEFPVRLLARGLDVLVLAAVDVGLGRLMGYGFDWLLVGSAVVFFYFSLFDALVGATLGKLVLGLRVLGPDGVFVFATLGLLLEALHGFKLGLYLDVDQETRRLLWRLGHAHGTLLGLLNVGYALSANAWPKLADRLAGQAVTVMRGELVEN